MSPDSLPPELASLAAEAPAGLVVQHNALVNARFAMTALEFRFFMALLSRIGRRDQALATCRIPVREICADSASKTVYADVRAMQHSMSARFITLEALGPQGEKLPGSADTTVPLMGWVRYRKDEGVLEAAFNDHLRPYLLNLQSHFTQAQLGQLRKLRAAAALRIYWLLLEYAAQGRRTRSIGLDELRGLLGYENEYADRFDRFRARVLDPAQMELAQTDLPFTYQALRTSGRAVDTICFAFGSLAIAPGPAKAAKAASAPAEPWPTDSWQALLLARGVAARSLADVQAGLAAGRYDEGYVRFVVGRVGAAGAKTKRPAGAIFKSITEGYLLADYQAANARPAVTTAPAAGRDRAARRRAESELQDARVTLRWIQLEAPVGVYPTEALRAADVEKVEAQISRLEQALAVPEKSSGNTAR